MSRNYSEEEKQEYLDQYRVSGKNQRVYAMENQIPEATFRAWVKEEQCKMYGTIDLSSNKDNQVKPIAKPIIFCNENIRIELKEGFDREYLQRVVEVISK